MDKFQSLPAEKKAEIIAKLKSDEEINKAIDKIFEHVDKEKKGSINKSQLTEVLKEILEHFHAPEPSPEHKEKFMALVTTDTITKEDLFKIFKKCTEGILAKIEA